MDQRRRNGLGATIRIMPSHPLARPHRERNDQVERLRGLLVLPFAFLFLRSLAVEEDDATAFRTSSTTSCHQCSAGEFSSPSSRWRVSANRGSWCQPSQ